VDDDDKGISHDDWRERWSAKGLTWSSRGIPTPKGWNATAQLATVSKPPKKVAVKKAAKAVKKSARKKR
jgi:hypothetical protein